MAGIQLTFKEFDIVKKFENSNATVSELRTGVFAPIEKISSKSKTYTQFIENQKKRFIETSWGKTVIKGNILTQTHRDLLDCLFAGAKEIKTAKDGWTIVTADHSPAAHFEHTVIINNDRALILTLRD